MLILQLPYLHWEYNSARERVRILIEDIETKGQYAVIREDVSTKLSTPRDHGDEMLLRKHLLTPRPVHIRRTLDQSYYWTLKDTKHRDCDQVVYRDTEKKDPASPKIVMVDQLWLWVLDGSMHFLLLSP
jgi:hypothetical protein